MTTKTPGRSHQNQFHSGFWDIATIRIDIRNSSISVLRVFPGQRGHAPDWPRGLCLLSASVSCWVGRFGLCSSAGNWSLVKFPIAYSDPTSWPRTYSHVYGKKRCLIADQKWIKTCVYLWMVMLDSFFDLAPGNHFPSAGKKVWGPGRNSSLTPLGWWLSSRQD
jgi:hypothetical protein